MLGTGIIVFREFSRRSDRQHCAGASAARAPVWVLVVWGAGVAVLA